ncbi:MAG: 30S ribosomal protein S12 methylthiotransferase RimO [Candidatus Omnitrophica bacterium]|nr:30S ribosomal protein S12 methylthiotransferase RimO [Candidatus Omnitrophota bacterium]
MATVAITSLGCPRNLVDSEIILGSLKKSGFKVVDIAKGADVFIVNTCAFVESARKESVDMILEAAYLKSKGRIKHIVICGCLPQLYKGELLKELPEADAIIGPGDIPRVADIIRGLGKGVRRSAVSDRPTYIYDERSPRLVLTPRHYAYVKISEGCDNLCSYCIIPRLRGRSRSRPMGSVLKEIDGLSAGGRLKEVNIIGQDTTAYGIDLYGKRRLPALLKKICALSNSVRWVRLLYTHPAHYTDEFIKTVRREDKVCKYLDFPVQHISDRILKRMNRRSTKRHITGIIEKLRKCIPGLVLRTSIIVGFPGETDREFRELLDFVRKTRFERLGAFIYSQEEGTAAAAYKNQVPAKIKNERFDEIMKAQQAVSRDLNASLLGKAVDVLIDEKAGGEKARFLGRTQGDAPEVDGLVHVTGKDLKIGGFYKVKITDTLEYDLAGETV